MTLARPTITHCCRCRGTTPAGIVRRSVTRPGSGDVGLELLEALEEDEILGDAPLDSKNRDSSCAVCARIRSSPRNGDARHAELHVFRNENANGCTVSRRP
jgi:hypothetical protein